MNTIKEQLNGVFKFLNTFNFTHNQKIKIIKKYAVENLKAQNSENLQEIAVLIQKDFDKFHNFVVNYKEFI